MDQLTGLQLVAQGNSFADRAIDIITIHGLQGYHTWEYPIHGVGDDSKTVFWVRDFLPHDLPSARIFTYHYLSTAFGDSQSISKAAEKLLNKLKNLQADNIERSRQLVFICHSVGGIVLQCALNKAFGTKDDTALSGIITATQGIIFLGTPHPTSKLGLSISRISTASDTTRSIMVDTQFISQVLVTFASVSQLNPLWKVVHCYEELPLPGTDFRAVEPSQEQSWALPQLSLYSHHHDLCRFRSRDDVSYIKVLQSLKNITSGFGSSVVDTIEAQTTLSSVEQEVLESLKTEDTSANIRDAYPGTCDWILEHNTYKSWLAKPSQPLLITGNAGTGKSTLMKHITEALRLGQTSSQVVVSYFFSSRANHSLASLLSSLLHQLLKTTPSTRSFEIFSKFHQRREHEISGRERNIDILTESLFLLTDKSTAHGHSVFFIIDALDECDDPDEVVTLLRRFNDFNPSRKLRICISSRPSNLSMPGTEIRMEDNNSLDIHLYLGKSLLALEEYLPPTSNVGQTTHALVERAQGTFLWVALSILQLRYHGHLKTLHSEPNSACWLPPTLEAAYETILRQLWSRHDASRREIARDAFILVLCAQRPLSILELRSALASIHYDPDILSPLSKSEVIDWGRWNKMNKIEEKPLVDMRSQLMLLCGGLLEVAPRQANLANDTTYPDFTVQFVHQTVRDWLQERGSCVLDNDNGIFQLSFPELKLADFKFCNARYEFRVAAICLYYVDRLDTQTSITSALFLEYSLLFGMAHLSLSERAGVNPMKEDMCHLSPFQKGFIERWSLLQRKTFKNQKLFDPHKTKAVHVMSYYGLPWFGTGLWGARLSEINEKDHHGHTPLSLAAVMGHLNICEILIENGADMGNRDYVYGQTPLSHAAACGHKEVVELLLSKGSAYDDNTSGVTALWLASRSGHPDIVELLLEVGADPNTSSIHTGEACLSHAASLGDIRTVHLLLDRGAEVCTRDNNGWTPLHYAVSQGRKQTTKLLLGSLNSQDLLKLKDDVSKDKAKGSWVNTVLAAIVILARYQRGGKRQRPAGGSQNSQGLNTCTDGQLLRNQGNIGRKHKLDAGKDDDGDGDNTRRNWEKRPRLQSNGDRFACPYHRKNQDRFNTGPCNGKGFENIDRLKAHLKDTHDRSVEWRRCHICKVRFLREELDGHSPCQRRDLGNDYEDGYDMDQAQDLRSDRTRPSKCPPPERCWREIFKVLFPDWPANKDIPNPYQENCADAIQKHCNRVLAPETISLLCLYQTEDEIRAFLEQLIGELCNNLEHTSIPINSLFLRPMPTIPSQPTSSTQYQQYLLPPVSGQRSFNDHPRHTQLSTPAVSNSGANSSQFPLSNDQSDTFTDATSFSGLMSTVFDGFESYQGMNSSSSLPQFQQQMTLPMGQQQTSNLSHQPTSGFEAGNQGSISDGNWIDSSHNSQHQPQPVMGVQDNLWLGDYNQEGNSEHGAFSG